MAFVEESTDGHGWTTTTLRMISTTRDDGLSVAVDQTIYTHEAPERADFVISRWELEPIAVGLPDARTAAAWEDVHAGVLLDWTASGIGEVIHTDPTTATQWAAPRFGATDGRTVGARVLSRNAPLRAAHFDAVGPNGESGEAFMINRENLVWSMPDSMLWSVLSPPAASTTAREGNVAGVLGTGPHAAVRPGESIELVVALSIADSRDALYDALERARIAWTSLREQGDGLPASRLQILGVQPNPFNPRTSIRFALPDGGRVTVDVFDSRGRRVDRLLDGTLESGTHRLEWDGRDTSGRSVASGVYFARVTSETESASRRLVLVR